VFNHAQFFGPASVEGNISSTTFGEAVSAMPHGWRRSHCATAFEAVKNENSESVRKKPGDVP